MINYDKAAEQVFNILKSRGKKLTMFQSDGSYALDYSTEARRFFVEDDSILVSLNQGVESMGELKMYISDDSDLDELNSVIQSLRQTANKFGLTFNLKKFDKEVTPKEFAFLAYKEKKEQETNESKRNPAAKVLRDPKSPFKPKVTKTKKQKQDSKVGRKAKHKGKVEESLEGQVEGPHYKGYTYAYSMHNGKLTHEVYDTKTGRKVGTIPFKSNQEMPEQAFKKWIDMGKPNRKDRSWQMTIKKFEENKMRESVEVFEAKDISNLWGTSQSSYQKVGGPAKMIVRHAKPVDEEKFAARTRNINKIFIENQEGERIKFPVNWLQGARAMTRHVSEGGSFTDDIGSYIVNMAEEYKNLRMFSKHAGRKLDEDAADVVDTVKSRTKQIASEVKSLQGPMSYRRFAEKFDADEHNMIGEDHLDIEMNRLKGMFNFSEDLELEESFAAVARITGNREKVEELKDKRSVEEKVADLLSKDEVSFAPQTQDLATKFKDDNARVQYKLRDLAGRARQDAVSVFLSRAVDTLESGKKLGPNNLELLKKILSRAKNVKEGADGPLATFESWLVNYSNCVDEAMMGGVYRQNSVSYKVPDTEKAKEVLHDLGYDEDRYKISRKEYNEILVRVGEPLDYYRDEAEELDRALRNIGGEYTGTWNWSLDSNLFKESVKESDGRRTKDSRGVSYAELDDFWREVNKGAKMLKVPNKKRKDKKKKQKTTNESKIIDLHRFQTLAGIVKEDPVADPHGGSMISPYDDEISDDQAINVAKDVVSDYAADDPMGMIADYADGNKDVWTDLVSDITGLVNRQVEEEYGVGEYFKEDELSDLIHNEIEDNDGRDLETDRVVEPNLDNELKDDPENFQRYIKKSE